MDSVLYKGFIKLLKRPFRGKDWEVIDSKPAVAGLITNEIGTKVLLVKQNRAPIMREIWEIPAGMRDVEGEAPCACLARELKEEADIDISPDAFGLMLGYYPYVGLSNHYLELYIATTKKTYDSKAIDDDDVTEARWFTIREINQMIRNKEIVDGKTILAVSLYKESLT